MFKRLLKVFVYLLVFMCLMGLLVVVLKSGLPKAQLSLVLIIGANFLIALFALVLGLRIRVNLRRQLETQHDQTNQDRSVLHSQVRTIDRNLSALVRKLNTLEARITSLENELLKAGSTVVAVKDEAEHIQSGLEFGNARGEPDEVQLSSTRYDTQTERESVIESELRDLVEIYDNYRGRERFAPASAIAGRMVKLGVVDSEREAMRLIHRLVQAYPDAIRLETIRGR